MPSTIITMKLKTSEIVYAPNFIGIFINNLIKGLIKKYLLKLDIIKASFPINFITDVTNNLDGAIITLENFAIREEAVLKKFADEVVIAVKKINFPGYFQVQTIKSDISNYPIISFISP